VVVKIEDVGRREANDLIKLVLKTTTPKLLSASSMGMLDNVV
jgi:hypothetical protein